MVSLRFEVRLKRVKSETKFEIFGPNVTNKHPAMVSMTKTQLKYKIRIQSVQQIRVQILFTSMVLGGF